MKALRPVMGFDLFSEAVSDTACGRQDFTVVRRRGHPFLYLPANRQAATRSLELYPAQSFKARLAKRLFAFALRLGRPDLLGTEKYSQTFSPRDSFATYLAQTAGLPSGQLPQFAVLAGNPHAPGRRFVFLLFDAANHPVAVVKAGHQPAARALITHEVNLLKSLPGRAAAVPRLRGGGFSSGSGEAFAMDFIAGQSPQGDAPGTLEKLFTSWLAPSSKAAISELPAWQRLRDAPDAPPLPEPLATLGELRACPTLMHGDFAPWNIKVAAGHWTVLDWERGEAAGIPAWDWFHFVVQPAVLVQHAATGTIITRLEELFAATEFRRYAEAAGIAGSERGLALAYVCYCRYVTRQTEGLDRLAALEAVLRRRWS